MGVKRAFHWKMKNITAYLICFSFVLVCVVGNSNPLSNIMNMLKQRIIETKTTEYLKRMVNLYIPLSDYMKNDLCRNHSLFYRDSLLRRTPWALSMLDSSSKIPDGLLNGNVVQFGNYDECLAVENVESDFGTFSGQHCVVQIQRPGVEIKSPATMKIYDEQLEGENQMKEVNGSMNLPVNLPTLRWSVCVPSTCSAVDVQANLRDTLSPLSVRVDDINCNTRAKQHFFSALDWFAIVLFSLLALIILLSTSFDLICPGPVKHRNLLVAFSWYTNGKKLLSTSSGGEDSMPAVHGVRCLSICLVVFGHQGQFDAQAATINIKDMFYEVFKFKYTPFTNGTLYVDSFLVISGLLLCFIFLREMNAGRPFIISAFYLRRYLRLTPVLAATVLLNTTLIPHMGDGPFWNSIIRYDRDVCRKYWWKTLFYINNYNVEHDSICLGHTWYLSVDTHLYCLSPLLLFTLLKYQRVGKVLLAALIGAGLLIAFLVAHINKLRNGIIISKYELIHEYIPTHTRFTPWLIGIGLGYILHATRQRTLHLPRKMVVLGWMLSAFLLLTSLLLKYRFQQLDHEYEPIIDSLYKCLMRPAWALGLSWVIFACVKGYGGYVNTLLSWKVFHVLGRLTFSVYLVHWAILKMIFASTRTPKYLSFTILFWESFGDLVLSFAAAAIVSMSIETPFILVTNYLLQNYAKQQRIAATKSHNMYADKVIIIDKTGYDGFKSNYKHQE